MPIDPKTGEHWVPTYTGKRAVLTRPDKDILDIRDIAHSLANICRYVGHTGTHYSVAEHSVWVARAAANKVGPRLRKHALRQGLLHDAPEAYLGDLSRQLKNLPGIKEAYGHLETLWAKAIHERFYLHVFLQEVKAADKAIWYYESTQLFPNHTDYWVQEDVGMADAFAGIELGLSAQDAENLFLAEFMEVF